MQLTDTAQELCIAKRRIYDIKNDLEGVKLIKKERKNIVKWVGSEKVGRKDEIDSLTEELNLLSEQNLQFDEF